MVANALLWDPRLFTNPKLPLLNGYLFDMEAPADAIGIDLAKEYLKCVWGYGQKSMAMHRSVFHHLKKLVYRSAPHQPEVILELLAIHADLEVQAIGMPSRCGNISFPHIVVRIAVLGPPAVLSLI